MRELRSESTHSLSRFQSESSDTKSSNSIKSFFRTLDRQNKEATAEKLSKYQLVSLQVAYNDRSAKSDQEYFSLKNDKNCTNRSNQQYCKIFNVLTRSLGIQTVELKPEASLKFEGPATDEHPQSPKPNLGVSSPREYSSRQISLGKRCQSDDLAKNLCFRFETPVKRSKVYSENSENTDLTSSICLNRFEELTAHSTQRKAANYPVVSQFLGTDLGRQFDSLVSDNLSST